jgi:hypothetical protein
MKHDWRFCYPKLVDSSSFREISVRNDVEILFSRSCCCYLNIGGSNDVYKLRCPNIEAFFPSNSSIQQSSHYNPIHKQQTNIINMSDYKPTEHDGLKQDGTPDKRVGTGRKFTPLFHPTIRYHQQYGANRTTEFAQGKVDPVEAGKQGGKSSGVTGDSDDTGSSGNKSGGSGSGRKFFSFLHSF